MAMRIYAKQIYYDRGAEYGYLVNRVYNGGQVTYSGLYHIMYNYKLGVF